MENKKESSRGGMREGSGRKKLPDELKKMRVTFYATKTEIDNVGGIEKARQLGYSAVSTYKQN